MIILIQIGFFVRLPIMRFFKIFWLNLVIVPLAFTLTVISEGESLTCPKAINVALRNAISQVVGVSLYSHSLVKDGMFSESQIETYTRGMVRNYRILKKEKTGNVCSVNIKANINESKIEEFLNDPSIQYFFQKLCFHRRKVGVYYVVRTNKDFPFNSIASRSLIDLLQDRLKKYQFRVFISYLDPSIVQNKEDGELAMEISRRGDADVVVLARLSKIQKKLGDFYEVSFIVTLKAYDAHTGEFFASVQKQLTKPFYTLPSEGYLNRLAVQFGKVQVLKLISKVVNRLQNEGCKVTYIVELHKVNPRIIETVEDILDDNDLEYQIIEENPNFAKYELISELSLKDLKKFLRKAFRKAHLNLFPVEIKGQTIIFEPF
jgi:hypothetical protein